MVHPVWKEKYTGDIDDYLIACLTFTFTTIWLSLWFFGSRPMRKKSVSSWWQLFGYSVLCILGFIGLYEEQLYDILSHIEDVWSYPRAHTRIAVLYFEVEVAWYFHSLIAQLINHQAKDFYAMLFHHIITPVEVYYSFTCGYSAIGLVIMLLHDTADIWLHLAKSFNYAKRETLCNLAFVGFTVTFFTTRLVILPYAGPFAYFYRNTTHRTTCGATLAIVTGILFLLHIYWFYFLIVAIRRFASKGNVDDTRDEEDVQERDKQYANEAIEKQRQLDYENNQLAKQTSKKKSNANSNGNSNGNANGNNNKNSHKNK